MYSKSMGRWLQQEKSARRPMNRKRVITTSVATISIDLVSSSATLINPKSQARTAEVRVRVAP